MKYELLEALLLLKFHVNVFHIRLHIQDSPLGDAFEFACQCITCVLNGC